MGKKGREIVKGNIQEIIKDLEAAYAAEWVATYYYTLAANLASGINAHVVADMLKESVKGELGHADALAQRIIQLGGEPIREFSQVEAKARCSKFVIPEDSTDLKGIINSVLELERYAIGTYQSLADKTRHNDLVTHELAEEILADEVKEEEEWENLLRGM